MISNDMLDSRRFFCFELDLAAGTDQNQKWIRKRKNLNSVCDCRQKTFKKFFKVLGGIETMNWDGKSFCCIDTLLCINYRIYTIGDLCTQIRRGWRIHGEIWDKFSLKEVSQLWMLDYECHLEIFRRFVTSLIIYAPLVSWTNISVITFGTGML